MAKQKEPSKCLYLTYDEKRSPGNNDHEDFHVEVVDWTLKECRKTRDENHWYQEVIDINFDAPIGSKVWVVYVRYSTGDSFGCTEGAWSILGVYEHQGQAAKVKKSVEDGTYKGAKPWVGYFESFESCEVQGMTVV